MKINNSTVGLKLILFKAWIAFVYPAKEQFCISSCEANLYMYRIFSEVSNAAASAEGGDGFHADFRFI